MELALGHARALPRGAVTSVRERTTSLRDRAATRAPRNDGRVEAPQPLAEERAPPPGTNRARNGGAGTRPPCERGGLVVSHRCRC